MSEALFSCLADRKYRLNLVFIHLFRADALVLTTAFQGALCKDLFLCCLIETQNTLGRGPCCDPWFTQGGSQAGRGPARIECISDIPEPLITLLPVLCEPHQGPRVELALSCPQECASLVRAVDM